MSARLRRGALALAILAGAAAGVVATAGPTQGAKQGARPNIVLVVTDDQTLAAFNGRTMPYTLGNVAGAGTTFNNTIATNPLCCPSRATMITGQYSHNTGVMNNKPGYPALSDKKNVLPTWLRAAGYYTAHVGRYLNEYPHGKKSQAGAGVGQLGRGARAAALSRLRTARQPQDGASSAASSRTTSPPSSTTASTR